MPDVVVAGHICLDLIPMFKGEFRLEPNQLTSLGKMSFATGGCVANVGLSLTKLGIKTALIAKIGDDLFAKTLKQLLEKSAPKATDSLIVSKTDTTSYTIVISPPDFDRHFLHHAGANNSFSASDVDLELVKKAKIFYFGYPPLMQEIYSDGGIGLAKLLKRTKALGLTTAMDLSFPDSDGPAGQVDWHKFLKLVLPYLDIFIPSMAEILYMLEPKALKDEQDFLPQEAIADTAQKLLDMGIAIAGIKLGSNGLYLRTSNTARLAQMGKAKPKDLKNWSNRELWSPAFKVEAKGTVGAGDASYAGFLASLLNGLKLEDAATMACAVGACSVEKDDAVSGVRSWAEGLERLDGDWARAVNTDRYSSRKWHEGVFLGEHDRA